MTVEKETYLIRLGRGADPGALIAEISGRPISLRVSEVSGTRVKFSFDGEPLSFQRVAPQASVSAASPVSAVPAKGVVSAPMPGKVIAALIKAGDSVRKGDPLVILESMKMEVAVRADRDAAVEELLVKEGGSVKRGQGLVRLRPS